MTANNNSAEQNAAKLAQAIRSGMEHVKTPANQDYQRLVALEAFERFNAFIAAGFTEHQALALTIAKL